MAFQEEIVQIGRKEGERKVGTEAQPGQEIASSLHGCLIQSRKRGGGPWALWQVTEPGQDGTGWGGVG